MGLQTTLNNWSGRSVTSLWVISIGGIVAAALLLSLATRQNIPGWDALLGVTKFIVLVSGVLGIAIVTGIAYSLPRE